VSISTCKHCKGAFWRYRSDHPPKGYCSVPHAELGPAKKVLNPPPLKPDAVLFEYRAHRISIHRDQFYLQDYDCEECERIWGVYIESMSFWLDHPLNYGGTEKTASPFS
jgi:hypothetical protein